MPLWESKLVDRYLRTGVKRGGDIDPAGLSDSPILTTAPNSFAAILKVPAAAVSALHLDAGQQVQICRGKQPFGSNSTVRAIFCNEKDCSIILELPKMSETLDPNALANATLANANAPKPCEGK